MLRYERVTKRQDTVSVPLRGYGAFNHEMSDKDHEELLFPSPYGAMGHSI